MKDKVINDLLTRISDLEFEVERLDSNNQTMQEEMARTWKKLDKAIEEIEKYKDDILSLENERDILKSKLSETKADIHYLLENGESVYIKNKYIRGDKDE